MKEIKFRAWDGKQMIELDVFNQSKDFIKDNYKIIQYTGLKDRSGKEIYEGDIIKYYDETFTVRYDEDLCGYFPFSEPALGGEDWGSICYRECKIIGNKFENPKLIN